MTGPIRYIIAGCILFFAQSISAATFTSAGTGSWNTPGSWSISGTDADSIPDSDDDVTIAGSFTVTLTVVNNSCRSLTVSSGTLALNNKTLRIYGNLTKTGGTLSGGSNLNFYGNPATITGTFTNAGNWYFLSGTNYTIASSSVIQKSNSIYLYTGTTITNQGIVRMTNGTIFFTAASSTWINDVNSTLQVASSISNGGIMICSASPNTVIYNSSGCSTIRRITYHNLTIQNSGATIPTWSGGALTVNGNLTLTATTLNCAGQDINLAGNWTNNANTNCQNMGTVTFNGTGTQTITRTATETFNHLTHSGTSTLTFAAPVMLAGNFVNSAGTVDVSTSNYTFTVGGNFTNNATFNARSGTVAFSGTAAQNISVASTTTFYDIASGSTSAVAITSGSIILSDVLTVSSGSFGTSGGTILLPATGPTSYARIGTVASGASLTGTGWTIQSYINGPATAYWQYLSTPISGNTLNDWDQDTRFFMSGVGGNDGNACCPVFYSVRLYNEPTNTYTNVTSIAHPLAVGKGYMVWMGDNTTSLTAPLVYDNNGQPNFDTKSIMVSAGGAGGGYNLVGNPYACTINYSTVVTASGNLSNNFVVLQENGSYVTNPNGGTIAPSQGFMCIATSSGPLNFTEASKNSSSNANIIRLGDPENMVRIDVSNDVNGLGGQAAIQLNNETHNGYDAPYDMPFLASPYENASNIWSTDAENRSNLLNCLDANADVLEIPVTVRAGVAGNQLLSFRGISHVNAYSCAWLEDTETGARINLRENDTYSYYAAEAGQEHRFILHFDRTGSNCPLNEQQITESLDAQTQVYVSNEQLMARFNFTEETNVQVVIYDAAGREAAAPEQYTVSSGSIALENPGAHGVYFVQVTEGTRVSTKKIVY